MAASDFNLDVMPLQQGAVFERKLDSNGFDVTCLHIVKQMNESGDTVLFGTGIAMAIPAGYCAFVLPRSSIGKLPISIPNAPGLIDSDYRGEICVQVRRTDQSFNFASLIGKQIAQIVFVRTYVPASITWTDTLSATERGDGGFGSTDSRPTRSQ